MTRRTKMRRRRRRSSVATVATDVFQIN